MAYNVIMLRHANIARLTSLLRVWAVLSQAFRGIFVFSSNAWALSDISFILRGRLGKAAVESIASKSNVRAPPLVYSRKEIVVKDKEYSLFI